VRGVAKSYGPGKPLLTIVTVVYNDEKNLENIINSISTQSYPNIEYIVIDGGSTDKSIDVIRKYEDNIDYWLSEKDRGIYDAMNKGVHLATGNWINFMNAGDSFYNTTTVAEIMENIPQSADLVYGHTFYKENEKMNLIETYSIDCLWTSMICSHQSIFVKTHLLKNRPFNLNYEISSDFDFIYYCYVNGSNFYDTKKIIAVHAVDGVSEKRIIKRMLERWKIVRDYTPSAKVNIFYFKLLFKKIKRKLIGK